MLITVYVCVNVHKKEKQKAIYSIHKLILNQQPPRLSGQMLQSRSMKTFSSEHHKIMSFISSFDGILLYLITSTQILKKSTHNF